MEYLSLWTKVAFVVLLISYGRCHSSSDGSSFRGPHHPRGEPTHQEHQHYVPSSDSDHHNNVKLTHDKQLLHDKEHLKEDLGEWVFMDGKEPTPEEMEFHYFKTHDYDNNSKLDGLEILQAISHILPMTQVEYDLTKDASAATSGAQQTSDDSHSHGHSHHHQQPQIQLTDSQKAEIKRQRDEDFKYYVELIDRVFSEDDLDRDGYLSYMEYSVGRRREEEAAKAAAATIGAKH